MTTENSQLRLSFTQLIVLLGIQVALLAGSFYLGTRFSGKLLGSKELVKDLDIARLLPDGEGTVVNGSDTSPTPSSPDRTSTTPFDKSASTVFRIKSSSNSEYTVQVASYPDESAASQVVDQWKKKGYMAFLSVEDVADRGKWFRVNVGNFGDEPSAQNFAKKIEEKEHITPQVVVNE